MEVNQQIRIRIRRQEEGERNNCLVDTLNGWILDSAFSFPFNNVETVTHSAGRYRIVSSSCKFSGANPTFFFFLD